MTPNPGRLPLGAAGRRVRGRLRCGIEFADWAADGRGGCRWSLTGDPYDIVEYEVIV